METDPAEDADADAKEHLFGFGGGLGGLNKDGDAPEDEKHAE